MREGAGAGGSATLRMTLPALLALSVCPPAMAAPPLFLYGTDTAAPADTLKANTSTYAATNAGSGTQPCGLATPCTDLNTSATASVAAPFLGGIPYGLSGEATAGVSNHGQGGSIGVLAWIKPTDDTTISLGLSVGASRWNGQKYVLVPGPARP
jgi:hypothetical protein